MTQIVINCGVFECQNDSANPGERSWICATTEEAISKGWTFPEDGTGRAICPQCQRTEEAKQ